VKNLKLIKGGCNNFTVTERATRPGALDKSRCFYCHVQFGGTHDKECPCLNKQVRVRMTIEYEVQVPACWDKHQVEFHRNEGSWCVNNAVEELDKLSEDGCLCNQVVNFEYLEDSSEVYLDEG